MNLGYAYRSYRPGNAFLQRCFHQSIPLGAKKKSQILDIPKEDRAKASDCHLKQLEPSDYNLYTDTAPPTQFQLDHANKFFAASAHSPVHLWTSELFRTIPSSELPEIAFIGRSNCGKSTLINALAGKQLCQASSKLGRTTQFHAVGIGGRKRDDSKFALVDLPGYGKASEGQWGEEILKYLKGRKQLRRVILLANPVHSLKTNDLELLKILREFSITHQIVLTKIDTLILKGGAKSPRGFHPDRLEDLVRRRHHILLRANDPNLVPPGPGMLNDVLATSARLGREHTMKQLGIDALRHYILRAVGLDTVVRKIQPRGNMAPQMAAS